MTKIKFHTVHNFDKVAVNSNQQQFLCDRFSLMQVLRQHRVEIDDIDRQIAELLGKRFRVAEQVAELKKQNNIPVRIEKRIQEVLDKAEEHEKEFHLPPKLGYFLWREIIEATCYHEEEILGLHDDQTNDQL